MMKRDGIEIDLKEQVKLMWERSASEVYTAKDDRERNQTLGRLSALGEVLNLLDIIEHENKYGDK